MSDRKQSIYRVKKKKANYTMIDNTGPHDARLSWKAKGILTYMLTMPDDWTFHRDELAKHATDGISSLRAGLEELKRFGYLKRIPIKDQETNRITSWETHVYEVSHSPLAENHPLDEDVPLVENQPMEMKGPDPVVENQPMEENSPLAEKPLVENPLDGNPPSGESNATNNLSLPITKITNIPIRAAKLPEILQPTAILFLHMTGTEDIREDDVICLRLLDKLHTPAAIQKEITKAIERLQKNGSVTLEQPDGEKIEITEKENLPFRYVYNSMKNWASRRGERSGGRDAKYGGGYGAAGRENKEYTKGSEEIFVQ